MRLLVLFFAASLFAQSSTSTHPLRTWTGINNLEFVGGYGEQTDNFRLAAHWYLFTRTFHRWETSFSLGANYSVFDGEPGDDRQVHDDSLEMRDIGLTPTATLYFRSKFLGFKPFVEVGIGLHYLTGKQFATKDFSTHFQFGDHIGFGIRFGEDLNYRLTYQFQHLSNGGIEDPNPGINFHLLSLGVKL